MITASRGACGVHAPLEMLSAEELAQHASEDDCWLAIHGKVYNVSEYLVDHPGGLDVMIEHAGAHCRTDDFCANSTCLRACHEGF